MGAFDEDTALVETGEGRWQGSVPERWFVERGPNGGLLAAQAVRAMELLAGDAERLPRSVTVHFLEAPAAGPIELVGRVERAGRSTTAVSLRFEQDGRAVALALGALALGREGGLDHAGLAAPRVPPPGELEPSAPGLPGMEGPPPFVGNYDWRWAIEEAEAGVARTGGWIRTRDPRPIDHISVAAFADAFPPAVFALLDGRGAAAPTIDLTVHFRAPLGLEGSPGANGAPPGDGWVLGAFSSRRVAGGFFEEDGELWDEAGTLLAQSRQLALLRVRDP